MVFSVEQRVFICNTFLKYASWQICRRKFVKKYPDSKVPCKRTIYRIVEKFRKTGSVLDKRKLRRRFVLTEEKLDEIGAQIETCPGRSLHRLAVQSGVSKSSAHRATKLLNQRPYKIRAALQPSILNGEARSGFCSTMACDLEDGEIEDGEIPDEEIVSIGEAVVGSETEKLTSQPNSETTLLPVQKDIKAPEVKIEVSSSKLKQPVLNRSGSAINNKLVACLKESTVEDDWAGDVEKAIKAAMSSTDSRKELKAEVSESGGNLMKAEDDDERKSRRKKRKKKHREDDDERKEAKKQKRNHGSSKKAVAENMDVEQGATSDQDEEDDDEMLYVRGASPVMRSGYSSPTHGYRGEPFAFMEPGGPFEDPYDSYCDDSDYEREDFVQSRRGDDEGPKRGDRGAKRRQQGRGGGRGLQNKRQQVRRKDAAGNKGKRMGNKRQQQRAPMLMPDPRQGPDSVCMFYMQGKCQKGDECPYSHDALPPRKMELCKFYLMDCCAKKDKCLYMHSDFPCKFYHTGLKCFAGERCKFSHGALTDSLRNILLKHLETAPKEILGDFPRLSREGAAAMVFNKKNRGNKGTGPGNKKIPSLFEIEVPIPAQLLAANLRNEEERSPARRTTPMPDSDNEDQDGSRTPMPSPPKLDTHNLADDFSSRGSNRQWDVDNVVRPGDLAGEEVRHPRSFRGGTDVKRERSEERDGTRRPVPSYQDQDFSEQLQQLKMRFYKETLNSSDEVGASVEVRHQRRHHRRHGKNKTVTDNEQKTDVRSKLNLHYLAGYSPAPATDVDDEASFARQEDSKAVSVEAVELADDEGKLEIDDRQEEDDNEGDDGDDDDDAAADGGESQPVASTPVPENNKKDQLDTDSTSCRAETGRLPHNLPKRQRELFLRIQQQQREAADSSSQDQSEEDDSKDKDIEKQQEENWYSSDEEEASLADVLKNLSKQQQQSSSPTRASTSPPIPVSSGTPSFDSIKLSDIDISESVSKLLSSIRHQQSASVASVTQAVENLDPRTSTQSQVAVAPTTQARDPRLMSRDPRNRSANTTTSMLSPSTRTSKRVDSSEERSELSRTSIYSSAITSSSVASTNMTRGQLESGGDVDLRSFHSTLSQQSTGFESRTDVDLRQNVLVGASSYNYGDTDLRGGGGDVDLRGMLGLPFKPVPMHTPATEIDASLTSHPPIPYKVVTIAIPRPDYSGLKLNTSDPQVWNDPRLRKLFKVSSNSVDSPASPPPQLPPPKQSPSPAARNDPRRRSVPEAPHSSSGTRLHETTPVYSEMISQNPMGLMHGTGMPTSIVPSLPTVLPFDPRHPRNPRNAPGILGPAPLPPNYCPNTPRFEDLEEGNSNGSDTDLRMFYGNSAPIWEQQLPQTQSQHMHRNRNWRNSRRNHQRFQSQQQEQKRSFTPPL